MVANEAIVAGRAHRLELLGTKALGVQHQRFEHAQRRAEAIVDRCVLPVGVDSLDETRIDTLRRDRAVCPSSKWTLHDGRTKPGEQLALEDRPR